ncbi:MAG: symmetrical bis(5'-nucleosyl)-tetraphosphatase [Proteobacteria bacterium]|nr:symmetrical bis(5'-nucleosyl)-tetraphosphatase [Pseudomonadota bacterium]
MATYAIGDIQGCYDSLQVLLEQIQFDPRHDRLWLAGDLVNRGPKSLEVLRWACDLGDRAVTVLGNHDVHLLLRVAGVSGKKKRDTLKQILKAPDRDELIEWLRHRPLIHAEDGYAMVHAGLHPTWSVAEAQRLAGEVTAILRADDWRFRISAIPCRADARWSADLPADQRIRAIFGTLTKMRLCRADGQMFGGFAGPPEEAPDDCSPWFAFPEPSWHDHCILFGHWAALGLRVEERYVALDSGCVWGGQLSAIRLDDRAVFQVAAVESAEEFESQVATGRS